MEKYCTGEVARCDNIACALHAGYLRLQTHTPLQQWLHESASVSHYSTLRVFYFPLSPPKIQNTFFVIPLSYRTTFGQFLCHSNVSRRQPTARYRLAGTVKHATRTVGIQTKWTWLRPLYKSGVLVLFPQKDGSSVQIIPLIFGTTQFCNRIHEPRAIACSRRPSTLLLYKV